jgi:hypothetical protein
MRSLKCIGQGVLNLQRDIRKIAYNLMNKVSYKPSSDESYGSYKPSSDKSYGSYKPSSDESYGLTNQVQIRVMVLTNQVQMRVMVPTNLRPVLKTGV